MCVESGLVRDGELFFDATRVEAEASIDSLAPRFAVEAHLSELFEDSSTPENRAVEAPRMKPEALPQPPPWTSPNRRSPHQDAVSESATGAYFDVEGGVIQHAGLFLVHLTSDVLVNLRANAYGRALYTVFIVALHSHVCPILGGYAFGFKNADDIASPVP